MGKRVNYKVDVPIKLQIWTRPNLQAKQFENIKKAKPSTIFIVSDGGRNRDEWDKILYNRDYIEKNIDWNCKVYKLYAKRNFGMLKFGEMAHEFIWDKVDRCIFFEDDHIPSVSYFRFCKELFDKYENDYRVAFINGVNYEGISNDCPFDYFFSRTLTISGVAIWKRTLDLYNLNYKNYDYTIDRLSKNILSDKYSKDYYHYMSTLAYVKHKLHEGHVPSDEFYLMHAMFCYNQVAIVPKYNMICNCGASDDATNCDNFKNIPKGMNKIFNQKLYELKFPIKHNEFILPDYKYEIYRKKIFAQDNLLNYLLQRIFKLILIFRNDGIKPVINVITKYFSKFIFLLKK